jgi:hypothetical protein
MPEPDPVPLNQLSTAARAALAVCHVVDGDRDDFDALLAYCLRVCWPTARNQDQ